MHVPENPAMVMLPSVNSLHPDCPAPPKKARGPVAKQNTAKEQALIDEDLDIETDSEPMKTREVRPCQKSKTVMFSPSFRRQKQWRGARKPCSMRTPG